MPGLEEGHRKTCEACGLEMVGARHVRTHKVGPILVEPHENGNCFLFRDHASGCLTYAVIPSPDVRGYLKRAGVPLRLNHFADCPAAARFRPHGEGGST